MLRLRARRDDCHTGTLGASCIISYNQRNPAAFSMRGYKDAASAERNPHADSCISEVLDSRVVCCDEPGRYPTSTRALCVCGGGEDFWLTGLQCLHYSVADDDEDETG